LTLNTRLNELRGQIRNITLDIIRLTGRRQILAEKVAREKAQARRPIRDLEVEKRLQAEVRDYCKEYGIDVGAGLGILNQLLSESLRIQEKCFRPKQVPNAYDVSVKARALEKSRSDLIHLEVGEPDFGPPESVKRALIESVQHGQSKYTESAGILPLRNKIGSILSERCHEEVSPESVVVTVSGRFAFFLSIASTVHPGDEVLVIDPSYPAYSNVVTYVGARPVRLSSHLNTEWSIDLNLVSEHISPATKAIILNSPNNPTGKTLDSATLRGITDIANENDMYVISDEVYSGYSLNEYTSVLQVSASKRVFIDSFSKRFGMTGFRLGYAVSDADTIQRMTQLQNLYLTCAPEFIQYAGLTALDCDTDMYSRIIKRRLQTACRMLRNLPVSFYLPDGGFYIFPKLVGGETDGGVFADRLLSEKGVCVVPGEAYGSEYPGFFRLSVCQPEEKLVEAIERMGDAFK
jgi:aspartate aminotransferase